MATGERPSVARTDEAFREMLAGGHPNSLGRTVEVVDAVLADRQKLAELYDAYFADDEVVRLRVSNAMKRVCKEHPDWLVPLLDGLLNDVAAIEQASTQWTLASLFGSLEASMTKDQRKKAEAILRNNLRNWDDWIVLNTTMETLGRWAASDAKLKRWLMPHLERLKSDGRRSVSGRAAKISAKLS